MLGTCRLKRVRARALGVTARSGGEGSRLPPLPVQRVAVGGGRGRVVGRAQRRVVPQPSSAAGGGPRLLWFAAACRSWALGAAAWAALPSPRYMRAGVLGVWQLVVGGSEGDPVAVRACALRAAGACHTDSVPACRGSLRPTTAIRSSQGASL